MSEEVDSGLFLTKLTAAECRMATESTEESNEREKGELESLRTAAMRRGTFGLPSVLHVWRREEKDASFTRDW